MLARDKYLEASYFYSQMAKLTEEPEPFKYNLSAFLQAFRSVTFYLQAEFARDPRFYPWYARKQEEMRQDSAFRILNEQRRLTVHMRNPRIIGKFTLYVRDTATAMSDAVKALVKAPDGTMVDVVEPDKLPAEFLRGDDVARVDKQFFFQGYDERDLFAVCLEGLFKLDSLICEWEETQKS